MAWKVEVVTYRSFVLLRVNCGSVAIESSLDSSPGLSYILNPTYSATDEINDIGCGACDVSSNLMSVVGAMTGESVTLLHMLLADYTSVGCTLKVAMLNGWGSHQWVLGLWHVQVSRAKHHFVLSTK